MIPDSYTDARVAAALDRLPAEFPRLLLEQYLLQEEGAGVELPRSDFRAVIDPKACTASRDCLAQCPVDAIFEGPPRPKPGVIACVCAGGTVETVPGASIVNRDKCIGCGVCVISCPENAIRMEPVS